MHDSNKHVELYRRKIFNKLRRKQDHATEAWENFGVFLRHYEIEFSSVVCSEPGSQTHPAAWEPQHLFRVKSN